MDPVKSCLLLLLFPVITAVSQEKDAIPWQPDRKLSWADFKGTPPESKRVAATTASGINYTYTTTESEGLYKLDYEVVTYFYPYQSWYHTELCDSVVLSHEQLHFDISELYARRMREMLGRQTFGPNVRAEVRRIFKQLNQELSEFQDRYDRETDFSRDREAQAHWNAAIARRLADSQRN
ncbi:MAG: DUF922 domain-containing protein [Robiginitalea sp.]